MTKRMGAKAMMKTRFQMSQQKTESMNHAYSLTNPKGKPTFSACERYEGAACVGCRGLQGNYMGLAMTTLVHVLHSTCFGFGLEF